MTEILLTSWPFIPLLVFGRISAINCHQAVNLRLFCKTPPQKKKKNVKPKEQKNETAFKPPNKIKQRTQLCEEINESYPDFIHHSFINLNECQSWDSYIIGLSKLVTLPSAPQKNGSEPIRSPNVNPSYVSDRGSGKIQLSSPDVNPIEP